MFGCFIPEYGYRLTDEEYEFIKGEVAYVLKKYNIHSVPVSGFELANKMGIRIIPYSALSEEKRKQSLVASDDGFFVEYNDGLPVIYYNEGIEFERLNMTILHEIAHFVLDHGLGDHNEMHEEAEAKFFAKYILAPPPLIDYIHPKSANDIKNTFGISLTAAEIAYSYYCKWKAGRDNRPKPDYEVVLEKQFVSNGILRRDSDRFAKYAALALN